MKINKNLIVFILVAVFVVSGLFSSKLLADLGKTFNTLFTDDASLSDRVDGFIDGVETAVTDELSYHDQMVDVNSFVISRTGTDYVKKDGDTVVKADNGYLAYAVPKMDDATLTKYADNIKELYEYTKAEDIPFLYVMAPQKGYGMNFPAGTENFIEENCKTHLKNLEDRKVPYLEIREKMLDAGISEEEAFFVTDHHWTPKTAFWATSKICEELNVRYGFKYDKTIFDINKYNIKTYENWFLGSQGKKVGSYFTFRRVDDIDIITPKFTTSLKVSQPLKAQSVTGSFGETLISNSLVEKKDIYKYNPYAAYTGGDFHIQTIENLAVEEGADILVIRDSFACAATPFLSLTAKNTHILDLRNYAGMYGDRVDSVEKYIDEFKPDYVIVMYYGVNKDDLKYTFNQ